MNYLLDTCVISELVAREPNQQVMAWISAVEDTHIYLSAITLGEIQKGVHRLADSPRKQVLQQWLEQELLVRFDGRILAADLPVLLAWGKLCADLARAGRPMPAIDSLIAAVAHHHGLTLVTRNTADFADAGVPLLNPWG